jgi:hypothetical protein
LGREGRETKQIIEEHIFGEEEEEEGRSKSRSKRRKVKDQDGGN